MARAFEYAVEQGLAPPRRLVLYVMADGADDDGRLWPGQQRLKRLTGLSVSTIRKALREFEEAGILTTQTRVREEGRGRTSNLYLLDFQAVSGGDRSGEQPPPPGDKSSDLPPSDGGGPRRERRDQPPGDGGPIDRGTVREPPEGIVETPTADFSILPATVAAPLRQVAEAKDAAIDPQAVKRAIDSYADRDHAEEAERFMEWHLHGKGRNARVRSIAQGFRNWLKGAEPISPGRRLHLAAVEEATPPPDVELTPELEAAWGTAVLKLRTAVGESTFEIWLAPLRPLGISQGVVYFAGPDGLCKWVERRYVPLIREALEPELGEVEPRFTAEPGEAAA